MEREPILEDTFSWEEEVKRIDAWMKENGGVPVTIHEYELKLLEYYGQQPLDS